MVYLREKYYYLEDADIVLAQDIGSKAVCIKAMMQLGAYAEYGVQKKQEFLRNLGG